MNSEQNKRGQSGSKSTELLDGDMDSEILTSPCGRCDHVFQYRDTTPWSEVHHLTNAHWLVCPGGITAQIAQARNREESAGMAAPAGLAVTTPLVATDPSMSDEAAEAATDTRKKNMMDEEARMALLEDDEWTTEVMPKSVRCLGCGRNVSLDKRSRYYPGLWLKHKGKCYEIKRATQEGRGGTSSGGSGRTSAGNSLKGKEVSHMNPGPSESQRRDINKLGAPSAEEAEKRQTSISGVRYRYDAHPSSPISRFPRRSEEQQGRMGGGDRTQRNSSAPRRIDEGARSYVEYDPARLGALEYRDSPGGSGSGSEPRNPQHGSGEAGSQTGPRYRRSTPWEIMSNFRDSNAMFGPGATPGWSWHRGSSQYE